MILSWDISACSAWMRWSSRSAQSLLVVDDDDDEAEGMDDEAEGMDGEAEGMLRRSGCDGAEMGDGETLFTVMSICSFLLCEVSQVSWLGVDELAVLESGDSICPVV